VAQYYADTMAKADLLEYVCQRIREARREPMATHQLIAALPVKIIVSTNYDCLIEEALKAAGGSCPEQDGWPGSQRRPGPLDARGHGLGPSRTFHHGQ
jgi:hypothetical protein